MGLLSDTPLITSDAYHTGYYSTDASGYVVRPEAVALPRSIPEVSRMVRWALHRRIPVTPRGAGTGLVGGALGSGLVLDTSHMYNIAYEAGVLFAEPGARLGAVGALLHRHGRILGPNPSVGPYCSVGGMVATNASGSRSLGYGSVIDNLESVIIVDGRGDVVELPADPHYAGLIHDICGQAGPFPSTTKNSCGYRLDAAAGHPHRVVAASEGTLGVVVGAHLATYRAPRRRVLVVMEYDSGRAAAADCAHIVECGPVALEIAGPGIMEGYEGSCVLFAEFHDTHRPPGLDLEGPRYADVICGMVRRASSRRPVLIRDIDGWLARRGAALSYSLRISPDCSPSIIEDATVPPERLPDLFDIIQELAGRTGFAPIYYGHAGSGNIHVRAPADSRTAEWYLEEVISLGGTITGEHGDGMGRTGMVGRQYGTHNCRLFGLLKHAFDPFHIMNPGKILPA